MRRRKDQPPAYNEALRSHVTRVGFDLTLGRTHIAKLVWINEALAAGDGAYTTKDSILDQRFSRAFANFVVGGDGLIRRGLIVHTPPSSRPPQGGSHDPATIWHLTRAGQLVIELLKETGIYQEYAGALPPAKAVAS